MTTRLTSMVALALAGACLVGCGDDDVAVDMGTPPMDMGPVVPVCPATAPAPMNQMGACCSRLTNADRLTAPELRLASLRLSAPVGSPLVTSAVRGLLNKAFDAETFNWLIQLSGAPATGDGPLMVRTGFGQRATDGTFAFAIGGAPMPGDVTRWDPITVDGTMTAESFSTPAYVGTGPLTIPVFDDLDPTRVVVELPVFGLELLSAPLTEDRTCVGSRGAAAYDTATGGRLKAFIRVADSRSLMVVVPPTLDTSLCALIAGSLTDALYCDQTQDMWNAKPNALCGATSCESNASGMTDICDPDTTCNAWTLLGEFAAQGVDISN